MIERQESHAEHQENVTQTWRYASTYFHICRDAKYQTSTNNSVHLCCGGKACVLQFMLDAQPPWPLPPFVSSGCHMHCFATHRQCLCALLVFQTEKTTEAARDRILVLLNVMDLVNVIQITAIRMKRSILWHVPRRTSGCNKRVGTILNSNLPLVDLNIGFIKIIAVNSRRKRRCKHI